MTWYNPERTLISDTECYPNFWSIGFMRVSDRKTRVFEHSVRRPLTDHQREQISAFMRQNTIVGYNFIPYDNPMIAMMLTGAPNSILKATNDQIILGGLKYWEVKQALGIRIPREWNVVDLIEPQPNAFASLKTLAGRQHAKKMQDLPYSPDTSLTEEQMDHVLSYMGNDLENTLTTFHSLKEPLELRAALTAEYGVNFMSKSDSQIGEGILKKVTERETGQKVARPVIKAGASFKYEPPAFLKFQNPELQDILDRLRATDFIIKRDGKVELPAWLAGKKIKIGSSTYAVGIGGLHSTEASRSVHADDDHDLFDADVTGFYPQIIINSKMYPPAIGPSFCTTYARIKHERDVIKPKLKDPATPKSELPALKAGSEGRKIVGNGIFGKTNSPYSTIYAPHLMIYTTLTGQLSALMLIEYIHAAGMEVVSANTDGVVIRCPKALSGPLAGDRFASGVIKDTIEQWERDTGFNLEVVQYTSLYNQSVNSYIAVTPSGKAKLKGAIANPWRDQDMRGMLMKNPQHTILTNAVVDLITKNVPIEDTIRSCTDVRDFVTVVNVKGGGTWNGEYLGKVVRYYWAKGGMEILYKDPHPTTGNFKKVPKSDGCRPLMDLPDDLPADVDYDRYIQAAREVLMDIGYDNRPPAVKPLRLFKYNSILQYAVAV